MTDSRELAADERARAGSDVAFDALHMGVRRNLMRRKLRVHHRMAGLAAEAGAVHIVHRTVGELAGDHDVDKRGEDDEGGQTAQLQVAKVEGRKTRRQIPGSPFTPPAPGDAERNENQTAEEKGWQRQIEQDAGVWILHAAQRGRQQKKPEHSGRSDDHHARQTDPVIGQVNHRSRPAAQLRHRHSEGMTSGAVKPAGT